MSRLLRVAAAVLFLTVLVVNPAPLRASGFDTCTYQGFYGYHVFTCTDGCQEIYNDPNVLWGWPNCIIAYCYSDEGGGTVLWVQCF